MTVSLRPLSLGELLDRTFQLYRNYFLLFAGISAVAYLPLFVIRVAYNLLPQLGAGSGVVTSMMLGALLMIVIFLAALAASQAATVTAVSAVYLDQPITVREAYSRVTSTIPRVILVMIGMGIGVGIGLLLLVVPGIILALMWALTIPIVVLEGADLFEALGRSRFLTSGHRLRVLLIYFLFTALTYLFIMVFEVPLIALVFAKGVAALRSPALVVTANVISFLSECLVTPLMTIALSLMYYDERVRKEAFDLQLMMSAPDPSQAQAATPGLS